MLGATLYFLKDISVEMEAFSSIKILSYIFVFLISTYLIYTQKIAAQWIVLSTIGLGFLLTSLHI